MTEQFTSLGAILASLLQEGRDVSRFAVVWKELIAAARSAAGAEMAAFVLLGPAGQSFIQASDGFSDHNLVILHQFPIGSSSLTRQAMESEGPKLWIRGQDDPNGHIHCRFDLEVAEEFALRITRHGTTIGALYFATQYEGRLTSLPRADATMKYLNEVVVGAAVVHSLSTSVWAEVDTFLSEHVIDTDKELANISCSWLCSELNARGAFLLAADPTTAGVRCIGGSPDELVDTLSQLDISVADDSPRTLVKHVLEGNHFVVNDVTSETLSSLLPALELDQVVELGQNWCGVPVAANNQSGTIGALLVCDPHQGNDKTVLRAGAADRELVATVAGKVGQQLRRLRRASCYAALDDASIRFASVQGSSDAVDVLLEFAIKMFSANLAYVFLVIDERAEIIASTPAGLNEPRWHLEQESPLSAFFDTPTHVQGDMVQGHKTELYASGGVGTTLVPKVVLVMLFRSSYPSSATELWFANRLIAEAAHAFQRVSEQNILQSREEQCLGLERKLSEQSRRQDLSARSLGNIHHFRQFAATALATLEQYGSVRKLVKSQTRAQHYHQLHQQLRVALEEIRDLADLVRLRMPQVTRRPTDIHELMRDMITKHYWRDSNGSPVTPQVIRSGELPIVDVDPSSLAVSIANMVKNSAEAGARDIRIVLSEAVDKPETGELRRWLRISVTDNGRGIDRGIRARIFDWGYTTKKGLNLQQGSGIGLADAWETVVDMHGGRISLVEGVRGLTRFDVDLPV